MHPKIEPMFMPPEADAPAGTYQPDIPMPDYREMPALNASVLKHETALEMFHEAIGDREEKPTESTAANLALGTCIHKAILEPDAFDSDDWQSWFHFSPTKGVTTQAALELAATLPPHITIITQDMLDKARRCRDGAHRDRDVQWLLKNADLEITGKVWDPDLRIWRKSRFDIRGGEGANYLADLKSTQSLNLEAFQRQIRNLAWDIQASFYLDTDALITGETREHFYFIGITKQLIPFMVRVFEVTPDQISDSRTKYLERAAAFIKSAKCDTWPGYSGITPLPYNPIHRRA